MYNFKSRLWEDSQWWILQGLFYLFIYLLLINYLLFGNNMIIARGRHCMNFLGPNLLFIGLVSTTFVNRMLHCSRHPASDQC